MSEWITKSLGDIATYLNGRAFKPEEWSSIGTPIIRIENLNNPNAVFNYYQGELEDQHKVINGDILVSWSASLDTYIWDREPAALNQHIFKVLGNEKVIDKDFLFYVLKKAMKGLSDLVHGATMKHVTKPVFEAFQVTFPKQKSEQKVIAYNLRNELLQVREALKAFEIMKEDINRLRYLIFEGFFAELDNTIRVRIIDKAETTSGSTPSRSQKTYWEPAEIPWIKTGEIAFQPITKSEEHVSKKALDECSLKLLPIDTVLIAMYGQGKTRGQSAVLKTPATVNQACFAILPNKTWEPEFLQLWLTYSYQNLRSMSENRGGNQANLNGDLLNSFEVPAPNLSKQRKLIQKISAALKEIDKMKKCQEAFEMELKILPNKLLDQAFNCNNND